MRVILALVVLQAWAGWAGSDILNVHSECVASLCVCIACMDVLGAKFSVRTSVDSIGGMYVCTQLSLTHMMTPDGSRPWTSAIRARTSLSRRQRCSTSSTQSQARFSKTQTRLLSTLNNLSSCAGGISSLWYAFLCGKGYSANTYSQRKREAVKGLVSRGQLEFVNGGWVMHDEAASHYVSMIDQTTLGHRFISEIFGVTPKIGWQVCLSVRWRLCAPHVAQVLISNVGIVLK
jgi:hypothetical protein